GDVIESVWLGNKPEPLKSPAREIAAALEHSRIATVRRIGKHIVFDLEPNHAARAPFRQAQGRHSLAKRSASLRKRPGNSIRTLRPSPEPQAEADQGVRPTQIRPT